MRTDLAFRVALVALLALGAAVYWQGLSGPFLLDDFGMIGALRAPPPTFGDWFDTLLATDLDYSRVRLLSNLSFIASDIAAGIPPSPQPFDYKLASLLLHLASALALFAIARELLSRARAGRPDGSLQPWAALLATAIFLLHPLQVSTVLYAVQRMALLSALFSLLAIIAYLRWRRGTGASAVRTALGLWPVLACAGLAALSKESGALVLPLLLLVEHVALAGDADVPRDRRRIATWVLGSGSIAMLVAIATQAPGWLSSYEMRDFSLPERLATQAHVLLHYLGQIAVPRTGAMGLYFDNWPIAAPDDPLAWAIGASLLAAGIAAWRSRRRYPLAAFAVLWFLVCHLIESTVIPLELVFEHRNYLAIAGFAIALGAVAAQVFAAVPRAASIAMAAVAIVAMALPTAGRVSQWSSEAAFIAHERAARPASVRARISELALLLREGRVAEADALARESLTLDPASANAAVPALALGCGVATGRVVALAEALRRFSGPGLEGDADRHVAALVRSKAGGTCEGYDWPDLHRLIAAALENPVTRHAARRTSQWQFVRTLAYLSAGDAAAALRSAEEMTRDEPVRLRFLWLRWQAAQRAGDAVAIAEAGEALRKRAAGDPLFPRRLLRQLEAAGFAP